MCEGVGCGAGVAWCEGVGGVSAVVGVWFLWGTYRDEYMLSGYVAGVGG